MKKYQFKYCLSISLFFIFSGCAQPKKDQLISIQKRRIRSLEFQLKKKSTELDQLKSHNLIEESHLESEKKELASLAKLMKKKNWILALRESQRLKKKYPRSIKLHAYRYKIFKRIGLKKQAFKEKRILKNLRAQRLK